MTFSQGVSDVLDRIVVSGRQARPILVVVVATALVASMLSLGRLATAAAAADPVGATAIAYAPNNSELVVGSADSQLSIRSASTGQLKTTLRGHDGGGISAVAYSPKGDVIASAGRDSTIRIWDAKTGKQLRVLSGHEQPALTLAFSGDGSRLISGGEDARALLWEVASGKLLNVFGGNTDFVTATAFSSDNATIATATRDARIRLWNAGDYSEKAALRGHTGAVTGLAFSAGGKELASSSGDSTVKVWDVPGKKQLRTLTGHQGKVTAVAFGADASISSSGVDGTVRIWDSANGSLKRKIDVGQAVLDVAVAPDATTIAESSADGSFSIRATKTGRETAGGTVPQSSTEAGAAAEALVAPQAAEATGAEALSTGPGGPILLVSQASDPFTSYYAEILRAEGLNSFASIDASAVSASSLADYAVVILAAGGLTPGQTTDLTNWVNGGGNLIAMRPSTTMAGLFGLTAAGGTLSEGYLKVDTSSAPGNGIVGETLQFHGTADRYSLSGARGVATLYSDATTATANPAVTLRDVGTSGGQTAAFTFDLARSIIGMRQGKLAWAGQERDGSSPIRSDDLYYGDASFDRQKDWVDLDKVAIPQADEQQRLLANLILEMGKDKMPLPRFWYLPSGHKAAVVMTGDDHGNNGTSPRFDQFLAESPAGCSVADWECIRGTSYIYPNTPISSQQAAAYAQQGFEIAVHVSTRCQDWTPASLANDFATQIADFKARFPGVPAPATNRTHCIAWSDWASQADVSQANGIRFDTNYYYWPAGWVADRPGFFTGSGIPMRFTATGGAMIDVYQAATQLTDESGQVYPYTIDTLLDRAQGPEGYYGAFTINAHTDVGQIVESTTTVAAAKARGVPVVTSKQMLDWVDGRNASSFGSMTWNGNQMSFAVNAAAGARNLQTMVPVRSESGTLQSVTRNGSPVSYQTQVIKGVSYAFVPSTTGNYVATYAVDTTAPTITSLQPAEGATGAPQSGAIKATFNEDIDPATVSGSTFELRTSSGATVAANVSYDGATRSALLTPNNSLAPGATYSATVRGGSGASVVKDVSGNALAQSKNWSFSTAAGPACPCSIWPATATPANPVDNDPNAVELGVRFRAEVDGYIDGVRFWKGAQNTGTHTGNLWTTGGQRLATAQFSNETASGWQEVRFANPVQVTANTTYIASYHTTSGYYAGDNNFFASSGVQNSPLRALRDGEDGPNGVYAYSGSSTFPADTWRSSNYWVDVVFTTTTGPDTTAPRVVSTSPTDGATDVARNGAITATFNEALDPATVTSNSVKLLGPGGSAVAATVSYNSGTLTISLQPTQLLPASTAYTATFNGASTPKITDVAGNALAADLTVRFTTAGLGACDNPANEIVAENCRPGNPASEWDISGAGDASIQGFATDISVDQGQTVQFKVDSPSSDYRLDIYRLGYYGGDGARKVATVQPSATLPQNQPACLEIDGSTNDNLIDCGNWGVSASWAVPADAASGVYIARPVREDVTGDRASHIIFVVRDDDGRSDMLFQTSDTTWQAYNQYGGYSLYSGPSGHAHKVSYNRPFTTRATPTEDNLFNAEYPMIRWIERNGYDVSYFTGVDSDRLGAEIAEHKTFLSVGHDEYWSGPQRAAVETARDAGVHLAFLSGNEVYWKTRWEPSTVGGTTVQHRTLVSYKEGAAQGGEHYDCQGNFACDPHPTAWTGLWRENAAGHDGGRPENALTGQISWGDATGAISVPATDTSLPFWRDAGMTAGTTLANGTLGYEFDWEQPAYAGSNPAGRITVSDSTLVGKNHKMSLYKAPSGSLVFGAGTVQWSWGLDSKHDRGSEPADPRVQQATINLLADMDAQPATLQSGMTRATKNPDQTAPTTTITSPAAGSRVDPNSAVTVSGTATDSSGRVLYVEVSTDGGTTWQRATGTGSWTYAWTSPASGSVTLQARAVDGSANLNRGANVASTTVTVEAPPPLTAPTGLTATANASGVALDWADLSGATGYNVYRASAAGGPFTKVNGAAATVSAWDDTQAPSGTSYYRVTARNAAGAASPPSSTVSATVAKANLLANPSFELDANADGRPDNWTSSTRFLRDNADVRSGSYAGRHWTTSNTNYTIGQTRTGLTAGTSYTLDGWVKVPATSDSFTFATQIQWRNSSGTVISTQSVQSFSASTDGWVRVNGTYTAPTGATRAAVNMVSTSLLGTVYVDDFSLR